MRIANPIEQIASSIYSATHNDLQPFQYLWQTPKEYKEGKPGMVPVDFNIATCIPHEILCRLEKLDGGDK